MASQILKQCSQLLTVRKDTLLYAVRTSSSRLLPSMEYFIWQLTLCWLLVWCTFNVVKHQRCAVHSRKCPVIMGINQAVMVAICWAKQPWMVSDVLRRRQFVDLAYIRKKSGKCQNNSHKAVSIGQIAHWLWAITTWTHLGKSQSSECNERGSSEVYVHSWKGGKI